MRGFRAMGPFWALFLLLAAFSAMATPPATLDASRAKLKQVVAQLQKEQNALKAVQDKEKSLLDEVEGLDRQLDDGLRQQEQVQEKIQAKQNLLLELTQRIKNQGEELRLRKRQLGQHIRLVYGMGEQGVLKLAFSRDNVHQARQGLRYFGYLVQARQQEFEAFRTTLNSLNRSMAEHHAAIQGLARLKATLDENQNKTAKERQARNDLLARVQQDAQLKQRQVAELKKAREEMSEFVTRLEEQLASITLSRQSFDNILEKKGKLAPPTSLPARDNDPGILYQGPENSPVFAVFRGQVVYADWFRGYGLLIILDHGEHVYSLYGHNHKLLVAQGDWVEAAEKIATLGDTGSVDGLGLYFEIRAKGRPDNPAKWLAKAGGAPTKND